MSKRPAAPTIEQTPAEKFFGLTRRPFSLTPDLRFAYHSRSHTHALEEVTSALRRREGLIVVTGAIGTGKTMLCRTLLETFEARTFLSLVLDPGLQVEDLLRKVLTDFGIMSAEDVEASGAPEQVTRHQFVSALQQFLASLIPLQAHAVIMVDEAQHLSPRVLEEIRLLSNFETDEAKLLQIVLVGQHDLDELLRRPDMQQLNQRVARRCHLHPLSAGEVSDYIDRRLTVAAAAEALPGPGSTATGDVDRLVRFTPAAARSVATISAGIPRVVNTLCDRALDVAYERQARVVEPDAVLEAAERLQLEVPGSVALPLNARRHVPQLAAAAAIVAAVAAGAWWWMREGGSAQAPPRAPAVAAGLSTPAAAEPSTSTFQPASTLPAAEPPAAPAPVVAATESAPPAVEGAPPSTPQATPPATSSASAPAVAAPATDQYEIAVAAFRTERRAQDVADAVSALPVPATVRIDATGAWYRVMAGPFPTSEDAAAAQEMLTRSGYPGTRMSRSAATP